MSEVGEGLLSAMLKPLGITEMRVAPSIIGRELVITFTEEELADILLKGSSPELKALLKIELKEGKMLIKVRL